MRPGAQTVVGIVSPGAMGSALAHALRDGGARVVTTLAGRSARTARLAEGLELLPSLDAVAAEAELLSVVPPGEASTVAAAIAQSAARAGTRPLLADLNAVSPATARAMEARVARGGMALVDGSISGPPPRPDGETRVYLSGAHAAEVAALSAPGVRWRVVGDDVGAASAVKMSTASVYKGSVALLLQALRSAQANGVLEPVLNDLQGALPELAQGASGTIQRAVAEAHRYVAEMEEIASTQEAAGLPSALFEALAGIYAELADTGPAGTAPEEVDPARPLVEVLDELRSR